MKYSSVVEISANGKSPNEVYSFIVPQKKFPGRFLVDTFSALYQKA